MNEEKAPSGQDRKVDIVVERVWHIGQHVRALNASGYMSRVYGGFPAFRYRKAGIDPRQLSTFPAAAMWNHFCKKARLPKLLTLNEPKMVGNWAASSRNLAKYVCCYGTAYRFLFPRLKDKNRILILESGSMHVEDYFRFVERAKKEAGFPYLETPPAAVAHEIEQAKLAHFVASGSDMMTESFVSKGFPRERILKCNYGIDTDKYPYLKRTVPSGRPLRICMVGIIGLRKGILRLIRMNEWAKSRGFNVELWLIGPVFPEATALLARTNAPVRLCGVKKGAALVETLHQCDAYSIASYEEGFGLSVVEAMCTGLPAIVSNETGAKEAITPGINGAILRDYTPEEFDRVLSPLFSNPQKLIAMSEAAREAVLSKYSLSHYTQRIQSEYTRMFELVEAHGPGPFPSCFQ